MAAAFPTDQKQKIQEWTRKNVDYSQEKKKKPYTFRDETSFYDWRIDLRFKDEIIDPDMNSDLEQILSWSRYFLPLYPVKVPRDGNCLLHAASVAIWGYEDDKSLLRDLLLITITHDYNETYRNRWWRQHIRDLENLEITNPEIVEQEWNDVVRSISSLGSSSVSTAVPHRFLESVHIYVLANILRRPIIIITDALAKSLRGDPLQDNPLSGIYLPLEWRPIDCCKTPLIFGYSCSHFCPLVSETPSQHSLQDKTGVFPLVNRDLVSLPTRYLTAEEESKASDLLQSYLVIKELNVQQGGQTNPIPCIQLKFRPFEEERSKMQPIADPRSVMHRKSKPTVAGPVEKSQGLKDYSYIHENHQTRVVPLRDGRTLKTIPQNEPCWPPNVQEGASGSRGSGRQSQQSTSTQCMTHLCKNRGDQSQGGLCDTCFKNLTIAEAGYELVSIPGEGEHDYGVNQTTPSPTQPANQDPFAEPEAMPSHINPTAPLLSMPESEPSLQPQSMMNQRCKTPNCGYRCSHQTYPYCHECFTNMQKSTRQKTPLSFIATAPPPSHTESTTEQEPNLMSFSSLENVVITPQTIHYPSSEETGPNTLSGYEELSCSSPSLSSFEVFAGETQQKQIDTKEKIGKSTAGSDVKQMGNNLNKIVQEKEEMKSRAQNAGISSGDQDQHFVLNTTSKMVMTGGDKVKPYTAPELAMAEKGEESQKTNREIVEISEEPARRQKCVSPYCQNYVESPEQLCTKCKDVLRMHSGNSTKQPEKQELGRNITEVQSEKAKQFSNESHPRPTPVSQGKVCVTPGCQKYGDPAMDNKCSFCYHKSPENPKIVTKLKQSHPPFTVPMRQSQPQQSSSEMKPGDKYEIGHQKIYQPVDDLSSSGKDPVVVSPHKGSVMHTSPKLSSLSTSRIWVPNTKPSENTSVSVSSSALAYLSGGPYRMTELSSTSYSWPSDRSVFVGPSDPSVIVTSMTKASGGFPRSHYMKDEDQAFTQRYEWVESTVKKNANRCKMGTCQNFGNKDKDGYCNACFGIYKKQMIAEMEAKAGYDVPDHICIDD